MRPVPNPKNIVSSWAFALGALIMALPAAAADRPRNIVLFIPDGLRALTVSDETAPTMAAIRDKGVNFKNPHSLFPTFTTPNASAMATGHYLGDTGDFSNTIYTGFPVPGAGGSVTPFIESDPVLGDVDEHFAGDYLDEMTLLKAARDAGISTATIGKLGPALIFDHTDRTGASTIVVDDATGSPSGIPLSQEVQAAMTAAGLPLAAPSRGDNGKAGNATTAGTKVANLVQQDYFADVVTKVVLPLFKAPTSPSFSSSGRATRTGRSTTRETASTSSLPASMDPPRWRRSKTPTTTSAASGKRLPTSGSPTRPTSL
jgi:hypothetical protein